ncbi:Transcription termination factor like [Quillaja saponaria]|uniref:Transcription termination factor like n=1 Tax=Quillaja saponaria TaxID=32244 RepID=A0AAD7LLE2_QUISA|nr:Transcription termination factor like [Quillaja saponaria]
MVAILDLYRSHSFSFSCSCSCITFHKHPLIPSTNIQFSLPSFSLFYSRKLFSVVKFSETVRNDLKPSLINLGFRPTMRVLFHCSCSNSLANTHTEIGMLFSFFRELGLNEDETERILINHPDITSVSLESMRGRILSLQSLGVHSLDLCHLLTKRPTLLTAEEIDQWVGFMRDELDGQLEPVQLKRLLSATEPRFLVGFDKKVALLLNRGVPHEKIVHILNNVNLTKALCLKSVEEIDRTIAFLDPFGGVSLIVRRPNILNYDLNNQLIPRIGFLTELSGGDEEATGTVLRKLPAIVSYSVEHLEGHVELLRSFAGLDDAEIFRILLIFPNVISASKERKLRPRIEFLKQCGLNSSEIFKFLVKAPLFLAFSFEENIAYKLVVLGEDWIQI